jgi:hypothetical protein
MAALIEILNLCSETLLSFHPESEQLASGEIPEEGHRPNGRRNHPAPRLVLIPGGLSRTHQRKSST